MKGRARNSRFSSKVPRPFFEMIYIYAMFVLNGILALSVLLLMVFLLALMSRINVLSRQIDSIEGLLEETEKRLNEATSSPSSNETKS